MVTLRGESSFSNPGCRAPPGGRPWPQGQRQSRGPARPSIPRARPAPTGLGSWDSQPEAGAGIRPHARARPFPGRDNSPPRPPPPPVFPPARPWGSAGNSDRARFSPRTARTPRPHQPHAQSRGTTKQQSCDLQINTWSSAPWSRGRVRLRTGGGAAARSTGRSHPGRFGTRENSPPPHHHFPRWPTHPQVSPSRTHHHVPLHLSRLNHCFFLHFAPNLNPTLGPRKE